MIPLTPADFQAWRAQRRYEREVKRRCLSFIEQAETPPVPVKPPPDHKRPDLEGP